MVIHVHHSPNPISGEMKRIINIDTDVAGLLSNDIVEIEFYSLRLYKYVHREGTFKLTDKVIRKHYIPNMERLKIFNDIWCSFVVALLLVKYKPSYYIEEWRLPLGITHLIKCFSKKTKVILDLHGAAPEEYEYSNGKVNMRMEYEEKKSVLSADKIICQSDEMKKHLSKKYSVKFDNIAVFRCGVDRSVFSYDEALRNKIRKDLHIADDEIVFVYSGGMHKWQKVKEALIFYIGFYKQNSKSKMLVLTKDVEGLSMIISDNKLDEIKDTLIVKSLLYNEVPAYLCASDIAFLIRDNVVMNAVASPTKLAEYMICGLPIISSEIAHKWVTEEGQKYIYDVNKIDYTTLNKTLFFIDKREISKYSLNNFSLDIDRINVKKFFTEI